MLVIPVSLNLYQVLELRVYVIHKTITPIPGELVRLQSACKNTDIFWTVSLYLGSYPVINYWDMLQQTSMRNALMKRTAYINFLILAPVKMKIKETMFSKSMELYRQE